ncbi:hypothetical protein HOD75_05130 [archaeon]|jgi:hypothetical protein|nr:hypothetical protein [Candidatus Woesearchaeota archaeon]MBT4136113.1 hypothetical protein [archaeon]MBT4242244.1 hypothetical protein [archaeon]MBT4417932.1 hypothetical protein [archaeon]
MKRGTLIWLIITICLIVLCIVLAYSTFNKRGLVDKCDIEKYECPTAPGINCMPGAGYHTANYCDWVRENCPNTEIGV